MRMFHYYVNALECRSELTLGEKKPFWSSIALAVAFH